MDVSKIRKKREALGLTRRDVSMKSGITEQTIHELEVGNQKNPTIKTLSAICSAIDLPLSEVVSE